MKLLYIGSGHPLQTADDLLTFSDLGIEWYSVGYYSDQNGSGDLPSIPTYYANKRFRQQLGKCASTVEPNNKYINDILYKKAITYGGKSPPNIWNFTKKFVSQFDIFVFNHFISNVINNLEIIDKKPIIFKTFAMHNINDEQKIGILRSLKKIIRVSNNEYEKLRTPLYGGEDYIIHGSIVPNEEVINNWNGKKQQVCTFTNGFNGSDSINIRRQYYIKIKQKCLEHKFLLYGSNNENETLSCGFISTKEKIKIMQNSRVHLVTGTPGSSCTYSLVESMIMGAPTVCYGQNMWQSNCYEPSKLFSHGEDILIGETPEECSDYINLLMQDRELCEFLSKNARQKALPIYSRQAINNRWKILFKNLGFNL